MEISSSTRSMVLAGTKGRMLWNPEVCVELCSEPKKGAEGTRVLHRSWGGTSDVSSTALS